MHFNANFIFILALSKSLLSMTSSSIKTQDEVARILGYKNLIDFKTQNKSTKILNSFYDLVIDRIRLKERFRIVGVEIPI